MEDDTPNDHDKTARPRSGQSYEVGYGKPPKASQFKKGQSGNPSGRPRGKQSFAELLAKAFNRRVTVRGPNRARKITGMEATANNLAALAINGNLKATQFALQEIATLPSEPESPLQARVTVRFVRPGDLDKEPK